jgi:hypothetical protein
MLNPLRGDLGLGIGRNTVNTGIVRVGIQPKKSAVHTNFVTDEIRVKAVVISCINPKFIKQGAPVSQFNGLYFFGLNRRFIEIIQGIPVECIQVV